MNKKSMTKGQVRKLNALRKSLGNQIADKAFKEWLKQQAKQAPAERADPVVNKLLAALKGLEKDKSINLGRKGYVIKRAKGRGVKSGFVVEKIS
tara:strand:- start:97 stop:378 length:282 start_codon:yes stop_codon:yes gene_type:complete